MLLGLWIYASARGICSSRRIERACVEDVAFRVLCGQDVPDHTVLARFRQRHREAMADLFAQVLALCVQAGMGRFGVVAIDGTKILANASRARSVSLARLRAIAEQEFARAEAVDAAEDAARAPAAGDDLPPGFGPGSGRQARIAAAVADLERQIREQDDPEVSRWEARVARREQVLEQDRARHARIMDRYRAAAGHRPAGRPPVPAEQSRRLARDRDDLAAAQGRLERARAVREARTVSGRGGRRRQALRNTTDPDSRIMHTRDGYVQAYNGQLAVTDDLLITVAALTNDPTDARQLVPVMQQAVAAAAACARACARPDLAVGTVVADSGYLSEEALSAPGPDRLIAPGRGRAEPGGGWTGSVRTPAAHAGRVMLGRLADPENQARYRRRAVTVEPVHAHLKDGRGLRRFACRGLAAAQAELHLAALTTNLLRLFTFRRAAAAATA